MSKHTKVRNYTDSELIEQMMSLPSYLCIPEGYHIIAVRSSEDDPDKFDDKMYLFKGTECISVFTCTTNTGTYGLLNFRKWSKLGAAVIKSNEIYYFAFEKSDGKRVRHHKGKMPCLRQTGDMLYYRDRNLDNKVDEEGRVYKGNYSTNIHTNSYKSKTGIKSWSIKMWSVGCIVLNNIGDYYSKLLKRIPLKRKVTFTLLKEF
jgi:hypothetical protein